MALNHISALDTPLQCWNILVPLHRPEDEDLHHAHTRDRLLGPRPGWSQFHQLVCHLSLLKLFSISREAVRLIETATTGVLAVRGSDIAGKVLATANPLAVAY